MKEKGGAARVLPGDAGRLCAPTAGLSPTLARRTRKDVRRAKRETGPDAEGARRRAAERARLVRREAAHEEKEKKRLVAAAAAAAAAEETPRWTKSGARIVSAHDAADATTVDRRCKACFYAGVKRKRCGSSKAPTFCFLLK